MVERFFRDITAKRIRRDSFTSVPELELAIDLYVANHNAEPKPFIWTASASDILAKSHDPGGSPWMMEDTGGVRAGAGRGWSNF
jgi:hypothetical protein